MFGLFLIGFDDPVMWRAIRCIITRNVRTNGSRKCSMKNRDKVAWLIENPPHSHWTIVFPKYGIADTRFVITVAPQNDICPHGRTYPRKAVAIRTRIILVPEYHVWAILYEVNIIPREMCVKIKMKNIDAPFMCSIRIIHP